MNKHLRQHWLSLQSAVRRRTQAMVMAALLGLSLVGGTLVSIQTTEAATTVPLRVVYNGHLLGSNGAAITTPHSVRFSFWSTADFQAGDVDGAGAINAGAGTYQSWNEVHTVTPDSNGYFTVNLGSVTALPNFATMSPGVLQSLFLQVEVKAQANPNTAYEVMDINSGDAVVDRSPVTSVPFSLNADYLDQREIGTGSGNIAILGPGGVFDRARIPGGTNASNFTIDFDNTETGDITLQFGQTLNETLSFDQDDSMFRFSDSVHIQGDLTVTGLINGLNLNSLGGAPDTQLKVSSGAGLNVSVAGGGYRVAGDTTQFAGNGAVTVKDNTTNYLFFTGTGLVVSTAGFPGSASGSHILLAEVITAGGNIVDVNDHRVLQSDDREHDEIITLQPGFPGATYNADGTSNIGQLSQDYDSVARRNFYRWVSTPDSLQDYDIVIPVRIPVGFMSWLNPSIQVDYRTTTGNAADNKVEIFVFDTAGNPVTLVGGNLNLANTSWTTANLTFSGAPTWTDNVDAIVVIRPYSKQSSEAHVGTVRINTHVVTP